MIAIIETGGKQYKASPGQKLKIEKIETEPGADLIFDKVLLTADGENIRVGDPYVPGVKVKTSVLRQGRARKVIVFRFHSKNRFQKKKGHRQEFTEVEIKEIF